MALCKAYWTPRVPNGIQHQSVILHAHLRTKANIHTLHITYIVSVYKWQRVKKSTLISYKHNVFFHWNKAISVATFCKEKKWEGASYYVRVYYTMSLYSKNSKGNTRHSFFITWGGDRIFYFKPHIFCTKNRVRLTILTSIFLRIYFRMWF